MTAGCTDELQVKVEAIIRQQNKDGAAGALQGHLLCVGRTNIGKTELILKLLKNHHKYFYFAS